MWSMLRNRQINGRKFVRQFAIGPYFADFVCRDAMLVVEIDGGQHADSHADDIRTAFLNANGYSVLRFWNNDVLANTDGVLQALELTLDGAASPDWRFSPATPSSSARADLPRLSKE